MEQKKGNNPDKHVSYMFIQFILLLIFLSLLFFLSQKISTLVYSNVFLLTKSRGVAIGTVSFFLLPGTIIHELSHFLLATLLRVPTGELTVFPSVDQKTGEIRAGRLMIGETDPFRRLLTGIAPMVVGIAIIYCIGLFLISDIRQLTTERPVLLFVTSYLLFITTNTMFSSRKDLESLVIVAPVVFIVLALVYALGIRIMLDEKLIAQISIFLTRLNYYLGISLCLNFIVYLLLSIFLITESKLLRRKLVAKKD
jgi:hypothetical protein